MGEAVSSNDGLGLKNTDGPVSESIPGTAVAAAVAAVAADVGVVSARNQEGVRAHSGERRKQGFGLQRCHRSTSRYRAPRNLEQRELDTYVRSSIFFFSSGNL